MRVSGEREREVDLVRNLEHSQRFLTPRLANETAQTQQPGQRDAGERSELPAGVEFDILSGYNPLPLHGERRGKGCEPTATVRDSAGKAGRNERRDNAAAFRRRRMKRDGAGSQRDWLSPLNLHWAGVGLLALVNLYLLVQMGLLWHAASNHNADAMAQQRIALKDGRDCGAAVARAGCEAGDGDGGGGQVLSASGCRRPTPRWRRSWAR